MDKATVKKYRDLADSSNLPMKVISDNEHWFLHNVDNACKLIWDDDNELLYALSLNNDYYSQCALPIKLTAIGYGEIQTIEVYMDKVAAVTYLGDLKDDGKLTEDEFAHDLEIVSRASASSTLNISRGSVKRASSDEKTSN